MKLDIILNMKKFFWKRVKSTSLPNLWVLVIENTEVGFVQKPRDTKSDKNMWRIYRGIGENSNFLGHAGTKELAQQQLVNSVK